MDVGKPETDPKGFPSDAEVRAHGKGLSACLLAHAEMSHRRFLQKFQPTALTATETFLECSCAALRTVPMPTPNSRAIARQEAPWVRS